MTFRWTGRRPGALLVPSLLMLLAGAAGPPGPVGPPALAGSSAGPAGPAAAPAAVAGQPGVDPVAGAGPQWPLAGPPTVTRAFDPPPRPWLPGHRGVDLAGAPGAEVRAAAGGLVFFAGSVAGRGVVSIAHPGGLRTTYQPVIPSVAAGDLVAAGDPVGRLAAGHAGCPVPACLHWGLRRGESYLDPLGLLGLARVRLLPRT